MKLKLIVYIGIFGLLLTGCATAPQNSGVSTQLSKPQLNELNRVIREASNDLDSNIPKGCVIAFVDVYSTSAELSDYILDELVANAVKDRNFTVADRNQIARIREEQQLQLSGEVADEQAVRIGRFSGAQSIVLGRVTALGDGGMYRLTIQALDVETANLQAQYVANIDIRSIKAVRDKNRIGTTVFLGGNYNMVTLNSKPTDDVFGYIAGVGYSLNFGDSLVLFEPGLRYTVRGYKLKEVKITETLNYLDIFLKVKADIAFGESVSIQPFVGIMPSFLLSAQAEWDGNSDTYDNKKAFENTNWQLPLGVDFLIKSSAFIGLEYDLGLASIAKGSDDVVTNAVVINVGWRF